jgi:hypothetical protein
MSAKPDILFFKLIREAGDAESVRSMKGDATKNGKLTGKVVNVKKGIM